LELRYTSVASCTHLRVRLFATDGEKPMEYWARRQRDTNRMARTMAKHVLGRRSPTADQLYALSKLSWITDSYDGTSAGYIASTKIPALGELLGKTYDRNTTLASVAKDAEAIIGKKGTARLVRRHTGFTNFYKAYRNSVRKWLYEHRSKLLPLYRAALEATNDQDRLTLIHGISTLPRIPKANNANQAMRPENFLTPVFFMLDPQIKFPIINGNKWVQALLAKLDVDGTDLASQYKAMVAIYGQRGVRDAADLDQLGRDLPDFFDTSRGKATKRLLRHRGENERDLALKDELDCAAAREAATVVHRKIHNRLTNQLHTGLGQRLTIIEGINDCKFDAIVVRYNGDDDLLIEVKSSAELPHLRMAVGQLFNYWFQMRAARNPHLAVLTPARPSESANEFLKWMEVGALWFDGKALKTCTPRLACVAEIE
jgi:hypothetical protein